MVNKKLIIKLPNQEGSLISDYTISDNMLIDSPRRGSLVRKILPAVDYGCIWRIKRLFNNHILLNLFEPLKCPKCKLILQNRYEPANHSCGLSYTYKECPICGYTTEWSDNSTERSW